MIAKVCAYQLILLGLFLSIFLGDQAIASENQESTPSSSSNRTDRIGDPLPKNALLRLGTLRFRHPSIVNDVALSPDQETVVSIGGQEIMVWEATTGKLRWQADLSSKRIHLPAAAYGIRSLIFAPDGKKFYTLGNGNQIIVWDTHSGHHENLHIDTVLPPLVFKLSLSQASIRSIDITPDGKKLVVGSPLGLVVCDTNGKALFNVVNKPAAQIEIDAMNRDRLFFMGHYSYGRFSPDGKLIAAVVSEAPEQVRLLDADTGEELRRISTKARIVRIDFSPDSKHVVATERDSAARLYAVDTAQEVWSYKIKLTNKSESYTSAVAFNPDGKSIAVCAPIGSEHLIHLLNAEDGKLIAKLEGHIWKPWALAYNSDGKLLYSSGWDGTIRRWDIEAQQQLPPPQGVRGTSVVAASPDGKMLAYADDSGIVHLVKSSDAEEIQQFSIPEATYSGLAFSPDSQRLAGGGNQGESVHVAVWDITSGEVSARWDWPKGKDPHSHVEEINFSPNGKYLAAIVYRQSAAYLWDLESKQQIAQLNHSQGYGLSFSPDSKTLATVGWDSNIQLWNAEYGEIDDVIVVEGAGNDGNNSYSIDNDVRIYGVSYSPTGDLIATAHMDHSIRIWQTDGMLLRRRIKMPGRFSYGALSFSPDGLWIAAGTSDKVSLIDPISGDVVWDRGQHEDDIYTVGFGRNAETVLSGADDGVGYLWQTRPLAIQTGDAPEYHWEILSTNGTEAFQAAWALSEGSDETVDFLSKKLLPIKQLIDLEYIPLQSSPEQVEQLWEENVDRILADDRIERTTVVRHAISILERIGSPAAKLLLQQLIDQNPDGQLASLAAKSLERLAHLE